MAAAAAPLALSFVWRDCDCKWAAPSKCAGKAPPKADRSVTIGCWVACCKQLREQQKAVSYTHLTLPTNREV